MGNMKLITIVNGMEDIVEVELLCAFESKKFDSKYIIYTKNEKDENKNTINKKKHGISFEEAETAFYDDEAVVIPDSEHSQDEERFILLGFSAMARLLTVCHCFRGEDDIIRIISARKATRIETKQYTEMEV